MLPKAVPVLKNRAAERFENLDKEEISSDEEEFLKGCLKIYERNPLKE